MSSSLRYDSSSSAVSHVQQIPGSSAGRAEGSINGRSIHPSSGGAAAPLRAQSAFAAAVPLRAEAAASFNPRAFQVNASRLSRQILNDRPLPGAEHAPRPVIREYYPSRTEYFWNYYTPPTFLHSFVAVPLPSHSSSYNGRNEEDNNDGVRLLVGFVAAVVFGFAMYSVGAALNIYQDAQEEYEDTVAAREVITTPPGGAETVDEGLNKIATIKERICKRVANSAYWDLACKVGIAASAVFALIGAVANIELLMLVGLVTAVATAGTMLFRMGFDSTDTKSIKDAKQLQNLLNARQINPDEVIPGEE